MRSVNIAELEVVLTGGSDGQGGGEGPMAVLLHGYGAPGGDLVPLASALPIPELRFAFPAAPLVLDHGEPTAHAGRAWWPIDMLELQLAARSGRTDVLRRRVPRGLEEARAHVEALLTALTRDFGCDPARLVLGGFSQGAMLSTDVALRTKTPLAGLAILSGSLIAETEWTELLAKRGRLEVFQSHGRADPVLPFALAEQLASALREAGCNVDFQANNGGHGIPAPALAGLSRFLMRLTAATPRP